MQSQNKICVIGAGHWGKNHIRTLNELGLLGGIVDSDQSLLENFRNKYPGVKIFENIDEVIKENFDGFTVSTPVKTHYEIAKYLIEHGIIRIN